jgi:hypothetical protein
MAYDPNATQPANPLGAQFAAIQDALAGATPIYGINGMVTGYNQPNLGRSYADVAMAKKQPLQNSAGDWVDPSTGLPYHGAYTDASGQTKYYSNGKSVSSAADVGVQTPVFTPTTTTKQPQISSAANAALDTLTKNSSDTAKSFADFLAQAKALNAQGAAQLTKDQSAVDPTATISRLNADASKTAGALDATNRQYGTEQQGVQDQVAGENVSAADKQDKAIQDLNAQLTQQNSDYAVAEQAVAGQAFNKAKQQISLYQLGSGTPTSASGNLSNRYIRAYADINVPLQADLANRKIAQTQTIYGEQKQADAQQYGNLINQYGAQTALNSDIANRTEDIAKYTGNLDSTTATQVQQLLVATAGMSRAQAASYLQQLSVPFDVGQHILTGDLQNLGAIQSLFNGANWYSVSQPYTGANVPPAPAYGVNVPSRSYSPGAAPAPVAPTTTTRTYDPNALPQGDFASSLQLGKVVGGVQTYVDPANPNRQYYVQNGQLYPYNFTPQVPKPVAANVSPSPVSASNVDSEG